MTDRFVQRATGSATARAPGRLGPDDRDRPGAPRPSRDPGPFMAGQVIGDTSLLNKSTNKSAALAAAEAGHPVVPRQPRLVFQLLHLHSGEQPGQRRRSLGLLRSRPSLDVRSRRHQPARSVPLRAQRHEPVSRIGERGRHRGAQRGRPGGHPRRLLLRLRPGELQHVVSAPGHVLLQLRSAGSELGHDSVHERQFTPLSGGGGSTTTPETQYPVSYSYVNGAGTTVTVPPTGGSPPSLWQDLCQYDTYSPNNFIDALGTLGVSGHRIFEIASVLRAVPGKLRLHLRDQQERRGCRTGGHRRRR